MASTEPVAKLDARYSSPAATATAWVRARQELAGAEVYLLTTVRPDGRPHVTPLIAVWLDGALYFCTGPDERKARNLAQNTHCTLITAGGTALDDGLDVVVEGDAVQVTDEPRLRRIAGAYESKYGNEWRFEVRDGAFLNEAAGVALVYQVAPSAAFGFNRRGEYSQTRWKFLV
jgi:hypothetical protein